MQIAGSTVISRGVAKTPFGPVLSGSGTLAAVAPLAAQATRPSEASRPLTSPEPLGEANPQAVQIEVIRVFNEQIEVAGVAAIGAAAAGTPPAANSTGNYSTR